MCNHRHIGLVLGGARADKPAVTVQFADGKMAIYIDAHAGATDAESHQYLNHPTVYSLEQQERPLFQAACPEEETASCPEEAASSSEREWATAPAEGTAPAEMEVEGGTIHACGEAAEACIIDGVHFTATSFPR